MAGPARITELRIDAEPRAWRAAGFAVDGRELPIGTTTIRFEPGCRAGAGAVCGWTLAGVEEGDFDGLPTVIAESPPDEATGKGAEHPNSAKQVDHVVVFSSELERTIASFEASGIECRRVREVPIAEDRTRQAFFRIGESIVEVIQVPPDKAGPDGRARFWGIAFAVADIERAVEVAGGRAGRIRAAVQPGRRIAPIRREAGLGVSVALITPDPRHALDVAG